MGWNYSSISKLQQLHHWILAMVKKFHCTLYNGCNHLCMLVLNISANKVSWLCDTWQTHHWFMVWFTKVWHIVKYISMGKCKKDVTPVHQQWSFVFLPLTHWYIQHNCASWSIIVSSRGFGPAYWCSALERWDTKDARTDCSFVDEEIWTDVTIVTWNISMLKLCDCIDIMILIHPNCWTYHS